jgi:hypothetical protein
MEKEFAPYELALKMRELGFDKPCLAYYDGWNGESHLIITNQSGSFLSRLFGLFRKKEHDTYTQDYVEYLTGICIAPTFSQAFRWFREKHNLYDTISKNGYMIEGEINGDFLRITKLSLKSHEEAELACLQKLIEILEKQK